jgi:hypothetical protein
MTTAIPSDAEARLVILEYRQDQAEKGLHTLRLDYTAEHQALRKSLQGIEKNLQSIKWIAMGAGLAFLSQVIGLDKALSLIKAIATIL